MMIRHTRELLGDSYFKGLLEEELFEFIEESVPLERKHKEVHIHLPAKF